MLAQENHSREYLVGSSTWKLSCMTPVPPSQATNWSSKCFSQLYLSLSILEWIKQSARYSDKRYENFRVHLRTSLHRSKDFQGSKSSDEWLGRLHRQSRSSPDRGAANKLGTLGSSIILAFPKPSTSKA